MQAFFTYVGAGIEVMHNLDRGTLDHEPYPNIPNSLSDTYYTGITEHQYNFSVDRLCS